MHRRVLSPLILLTLVACPGDKGGYTLYNTPPSVTISTPPSGSSFLQYEVVTFAARVADDQDAPPDLDLTWSSSIDGELAGALPADADGNVSYSTANLSPGNHVITLMASDTDAEADASTVQITITDQPENPTVNLIHPASGESGLEGEPYEFVVEVSDSLDAPEDLLLTFESSIDGVFCTPVADEAGIASCTTELSATPSGTDPHLLTFTAVDSDGDEGNVTAYFTVVSRDAYDDDGDGWNEVQGDCDDGDADIHPGATEQPNGVDDDCDGVIDNDTDNYDDDGDGYSEADGDCDDTDPYTYPDAPETYDGADNDCDRIVDEGTSAYDDDGDGYTELAGDCDDEYALTYPGATELADGRDNDCNGLVDDGTELYDDDGDGYAESEGDCDDDNDDIHPGATETCGDGVDNNCNGSADEEGASGCTTYYRDYDGDGYGDPDLSSCLCSASDPYTSRYDNDCYDYNASANPAATGYYTTSRGDGSYDYNCDGTESEYYTARGACDYELLELDCILTTGWESSTAACGSTGRYITGCTTLEILGIPYDCSNNTSKYTQPCH